MVSCAGGVTAFCAISGVVVIVVLMNRIASTNLGFEFVLGSVSSVPFIDLSP
jgi:hypothetical protein